MGQKVTMRLEDMIFTGIFRVQISSKIILGRGVGLVRILVI